VPYLTVPWSYSPLYGIAIAVLLVRLFQSLAGWCYSSKAREDHERSAHLLLSHIVVVQCFLGYFSSEDFSSNTSTIDFHLARAIGACVAAAMTLATLFWLIRLLSRLSVRHQAVWPTLFKGLLSRATGRVLILISMVLFGLTSLVLRRGAVGTADVTLRPGNALLSEHYSLDLFYVISLPGEFSALSWVAFGFMLGTLALNFLRMLLGKSIARTSLCGSRLGIILGILACANVYVGYYDIHRLPVDHLAISLCLAALVLYTTLSLVVVNELIIWIANVIVPLLGSPFGHVMNEKS
jgi:hypothetical protein